LKLSDQNCFVLEIGPSNEFAKRINNAAAASGENSLWRITERASEFLWKIPPAAELIASEHEATTFRRDVLHCGYPGLAMIRCGCTVNFDALRVHVHSQERHVVFPADHRAYSAQRRVEHR
jgi:hypothetical protein